MLGVEVHRDAAAGGHEERPLLDDGGVGELGAGRRLPGGKVELARGLVGLHDGGPELLLAGGRREALHGVAGGGPADKRLGAHHAGLVATVGTPDLGSNLAAVPPAVLLEGLLVTLPVNAHGSDDARKKCLNVGPVVALAIAGSNRIIAPVNTHRLVDVQDDLQVEVAVRRRLDAAAVCALGTGGTLGQAREVDLEPVHDGQHDIGCAHRGGLPHILDNEEVERIEGVPVLERVALVHEAGGLAESTAHGVGVAREDCVGDGVGVSPLLPPGQGRDAVVANDLLGEDREVDALAMLSGEKGLRVIETGEGAAARAAHAGRRVEVAGDAAEVVESAVVLNGVAGMLGREHVL